ncbi:MAG: MBOAT family protein [Phycisphaerae bacterium]|jgi:D-alanyl-lipoteichoic acid acyltransferase DltB (MBOAT superfamily)|nr:MBOAT family protein [Phycisphaerae bacterium]
MYFNSYTYLVFFLPLVVLGYFKLHKLRMSVAARGLLVGASIFFYSYWAPKYAALILFSAIFNFSLGTIMSSSLKQAKARQVKITLIFGIIVNLGLLGYYKYADFFIANVNQMLGTEYPALKLILPLAISFFTFQQIAYLVDSSKGLTREYDFLSYCLFVCFFPQLIAGPIVHHGEMMPQFSRKRARILHWDNVFRGIVIIVIGLFKKVIIADSLAPNVAAGFDSMGSQLSFAESWCSVLSFTLQIYFDFSGYTDMAMGSALMFNINLPLNFNSPYKARSIQEFWQRWHMTLSRWLRDYVYIPLGGSRCSKPRIYRNLFITFLLGGIWHGAGWTFVIWGALHGLGTCIHKLWKNMSIRLPGAAGWFFTFVFVAIAWVFFRATTLGSARMVLEGMCGFNGLGFGEDRVYHVGSGDWANLGILVGIALFASNSMEITRKCRPTLLLLAAAVVMFVISVLNFTGFSEFLYFNF